MKYAAHNRGFALIFSVVVIAVVTVVTLSMSSLTRKSLDLTSSGIESQEAFYAADAGIECALYWDIARRSDMRFRTAAASGTLECFDNPSVLYNCSGDGVTNVCDIDATFDTDKEADITIDINGTDTEVDVRGYNKPIGSTPPPTERGLRVEY